ncbi:hypothetical protein C8R46DRAFT_1219565 [Mycena filopes]|nr:hypothetical protein C8R46DRAFT_1219565 [Mycena filopes]
MTAEEMIPDTLNPAHDPRFWCLPPVRDQASETRSRKGKGYPMYLVAQGRRVGIWKNWTAAEAAVTGFPSAAYRGHATVDSCIEEWQVHCQLGLHPHPPCPTPTPSITAANPDIANSAALALGRLTLGTASGPSKTRRAPSWTSSVTSALSTMSSVISSDWDDTPEIARYFALWRGQIVHTQRERARADFMAAEAKGVKPRVLSTSLYEEAQAFAEGVHWVDD